MQPPSQDLITQFTEDTFAKEDRVCQRTRCQASIQKGEPCHYVAVYDPTQPGRFVCGECYKWYKNKPATTARVLNTNSTSMPVPDPHSIHQSISAAQSRASVNPPPVMAISNSAQLNVGNLGALVPPQSLQAPRYSFAPPFPPTPFTGGPNVYVPSAWKKDQQPAPPMAHPAASSHLMALPPGSSGYGAQHLQYAAQRECWARMAHRPPPAEMISLEISAVFEAGGKKKNVRSNNIGSICEGLKDIDTQSTAHELASIALETVAPRIKAYFPQFAWWENEFIVRDSKWVDLTRHPSTQPYFYSECIHPSNQKGSKATAFKTKQFGLFVIVPEMQWEEFDTFREKLEPPQPPPPRPRRMPPDQNKLQPTQPTCARMISLLRFHRFHMPAAAVCPRITDTCFLFLFLLVTLADAMRSLDVSRVT
ncbi:hypothetical protein SCLCIDRAFT_102259 [Scleroderma citrinum Foug A]|uniref:Uncharacterized protein n=1 Tax=Scleroderma citrinum Foug A TaxID=1036808 RepID=A0A0C3EAX1_9AGAM|nr:hypothetical protein SCLCIDRAFT_102259 [Scleroderma citrinum Foug A]